MFNKKPTISISFYILFQNSIGKRIHSQESNFLSNALNCILLIFTKLLVYHNLLPKDGSRTLNKLKQITSNLQDIESLKTCITKTFFIDMHNKIDTHFSCSSWHFCNCIYIVYYIIKNYDIKHFII